MTRSELLQYTKEDRLAILQKFGRDDESVQKDVKSLENSGFLPEHIGKFKQYSVQHLSC